MLTNPCPRPVLSRSAGTPSHKLETVEFVLFHLYSGAMYVPEDVDLSDLITLAVMLNHKPLIRMAEFAMRVRLCHMFHKVGCRQLTAGMGNNR